MAIVHLSFMTVALSYCMPKLIGQRPNWPKDLLACWNLYASLIQGKYLPFNDYVMKCIAGQSLALTMRSLAAALPCVSWLL